MKRFTVEVEGITAPEGDTYTVYASSEKEAREKAIKQFEKYFGDDYDHIETTIKK